MFYDSIPENTAVFIRKPSIPSVNSLGGAFRPDPRPPLTTSQPPWLETEANFNPPTIIIISPNKFTFIR